MIWRKNLSYFQTHGYTQTLGHSWIYRPDRTSKKPSSPLIVFVAHTKYIGHVWHLRCSFFAAILMIVIGNYGNHDAVPIAGYELMWFPIVIQFTLFVQAHAIFFALRELYQCEADPEIVEHIFSVMEQILWTQYILCTWLDPKRHHFWQEWRSGITKNTFCTVHDAE
jgi:hypothetical protein